MLFLQGAEILHGGNRSGFFFKMDHSNILHTVDKIARELHNVGLTHLFLDSRSYSLIVVAAPEAQRETVFVCAACNSSLIKLHWNGMSLLSPSGQLEVIHCPPPSPAPSYWNPHKYSGFQIKALLSVCQDTSRVVAPHMPLPVASHLSYSCCLWDFYCNMLNISCFNPQWRTGPLWINETFYRAKSKDLFPLLSRGRCKACQVEARIGLVVSGRLSVVLLLRALPRQQNWFHLDVDIFSPV